MLSWCTLACHFCSGEEGKEVKLLEWWLLRRREGRDMYAHYTRSLLKPLIQSFGVQEARRIHSWTKWYISWYIPSIHSAKKQRQKGDKLLRHTRIYVSLHLCQLFALCILNVYQGTLIACLTVVISAESGAFLQIWLPTNSDWENVECPSLQHMCKEITFMFPCVHSYRIYSNVMRVLSPDFCYLNSTLVLQLNT